MSSADLADAGVAEGIKSAAGRSTGPMRAPAWPRRSVRGATACLELPTSRALLFTLQWLCVGLIGLVCHIVLVRQAGSASFVVLMAALLLLHRNNPLAGFVVYLQILLYQNVVISLFTTRMTASEYTLLSGTSFIGGMVLVSGSALRMLLTRRPFKAGHRGVVRTTILLYGVWRNTASVKLLLIFGTALAVVYVGYGVWSGERAGDYHVIGFGIGLVNGAFQEEAYSPYAVGLLALFCGVLVANGQRSSALLDANAP